MPRTFTIQTVDLATAKRLIREKQKANAQTGTTANQGRQVGLHNGVPIFAKDGRFGPYLEWTDPTLQTLQTLSCPHKTARPDNLSLEQAQEWAGCTTMERVGVELFCGRVYGTIAFSCFLFGICFLCLIVVLLHGGGGGRGGLCVRGGGVGVIICQHECSVAGGGGSRGGANPENPPAKQAKHTQEFKEGDDVVTQYKPEGEHPVMGSTIYAGTVVTRNPCRIRYSQDCHGTKYTNKVVPVPIKFIHKRYIQDKDDFIIDRLTGESTNTTGTEYPLQPD